MAGPRASIRVNRLAGEIVKILATTIDRRYRTELPAMLSISSCEITRDLKQAKVFYSIFGGEAELAQAKYFFERHAGELRTAIAKSLSTRTVPELLFIFDASSVRAARVEELLSKIQNHRDDD